MSNNIEGKVVTGSRQAAANYSYPGDLARFVRDRWRDVPEPPGGIELLPDAATLEDFFSACYHASMLREEERPVTFRAILAAPGTFRIRRETARGSAAARILRLAALRSEGTQAALGSC